MALPKASVGSSGSMVLVDSGAVGYGIGDGQQAHMRAVDGPEDRHRLVCRPTCLGQVHPATTFRPTRSSRLWSTVIKAVDFRMPKGPKSMRST